MNPHFDFNSPIIGYLSSFCFVFGSCTSTLSMWGILIESTLQVLRQLREETASMRGSQMQVLVTVLLLLIIKHFASGKI